MSTIVEALTRDVVHTDRKAEGAALIKKWEKVGLLEGLSTERSKINMSVLLENQAKELLREASSMSAGDVEGFASVAFPIVRRVFGGLIANELVSVQPMSLPSGLIFFLDFVYSGNTPEKLHNGAVAGASLFGGGVVGKGITGGVDLSGDNAETSFYGLNNGFSTATGSINAGEADTNVQNVALLGTETLVSDLSALDKKVLRYDPDVLGSTPSDIIAAVVVTLSTAEMAQIDGSNLVTIDLVSSSTTSDVRVPVDGALGATETKVIRRLTHKGAWDATATTLSDEDTKITFYLQSTTAGGLVAANVAGNPGLGNTLKFSRKDSWGQGNSVGSVLAELLVQEGAGSSSVAGDEKDGHNRTISEIDIKLDSISVDVKTKKLKAKWTPELAQDINAYHNIDAEVELTGILSEHVALEIDQEILNELVSGGTGGTLYWSRHAGNFLNRETGASVVSATAPPDFTGNVSEWYETLIETINDVSARIHRKTLRGGANFLVTSPEIANILEFTSGFRATVNMEDLKGGSVGAEKVGSLSRKWDVYVDPYFYRNVILVGRKGKSFLESGFVYAPYVPLQTTPTIFGTEDFVPRKGMMTRYAKKMVRPDMYGLVVVQDLV